jgi:undecaprenyl diphosphate synthase
VTQSPPDLPGTKIPRHIAVIMDGNGRWARQRLRPRATGHRAGVRAARALVRYCMRRGVEVLTLFAFSQENWERPAPEVALLMRLFVHTLRREMKHLHENDVRVRFIGAHQQFPEQLREQMRQTERLTRANGGMWLVIAAGYGGRWDIVHAAEQLRAAGTPITTASLNAQLQTADLAPPDLLIRTSGEHRISNFMLWQLAYSELYFTDTLWPDFDEREFERALAWYASRERRFGRVAEAG